MIRRVMIFGAGVQPLSFFEFSYFWRLWPSTVSLAPRCAKYDKLCAKEHQERWSSERRQKKNSEELRCAIREAIRFSNKNGGGVANRKDSFLFVVNMSTKFWSFYVCNSNFVTALQQHSFQTVSNLWYLPFKWQVTVSIFHYVSFSKFCTV